MGIGSDQEETQDMDASSSVAQIAEEINSFSQLSGPVTVAAEAAGTIFKVLIKKHSCVLTSDYLHQRKFKKCLHQNMATNRP